jgi:hypothetical protein
MKDPNQVVKIEKAIADKYGTETILNPKSLWNEDKEKEYQEQIKELQQKQLFIEENSHKVEIDGVFISKKLLNKDSKRTCPVCSIYSFSLEDDIYMNKFECCKICYVKYVENREERWKSGWRPSKDANNKVKT